MNYTRRLLLSLGASIISGCTQLIKPVRSIVRLAIQLHEKDRFIFSTTFWRVELKKNQTYVGSSTIRLKRVEEKLRNLTDEEWMELKRVVEAMEFACEEEFGGGPANWYFSELASLMNHAYQAWPAVPLVHLHFHWRKKEKTMIGNYEIPEDSGFGYERPPHTNHQVPQWVEKEIIRRLQERLIRFAKLQQFPVILPDGTTYS